MGKTDSDAVKTGRKRQLNVIYFVDSARTRSFTVPLGRLNVMLFGALTLIAWSVASLFVIVWLVDGRDDLAARLRQSLATIFEYETREDKVFDVAYPPAGKPGGTSDIVASVKATTPAATAHLAAKSPAPTQSSTGISVGGPQAGGAMPAKAAATQPAAAAPVDEEVDDKAPATEAAAHVEPAVTVGNPVLEAGASALQLRFDLTSKSTNDRVEGYIYAVAEFKTEQGERLFIGAPGEIHVKDDGEPSVPMKAALFGIRRFKQKTFSFPFPAGKSGTFTGVKINVMDRSGGNKTTYSVPVQIKVAKNEKDSAG